MRRIALATLLASVALLALAPAHSARDVALAADTPCSPLVQFAPTLASDRNPDGSPVRTSLDHRGRYVPVVMVHGWTAKATHDRTRSGTFSHLMDLSTILGTTVQADRSLIGQIQRIPGAAVFTFDYHDFAARWVDDEHLGPALGKAIDCLYALSGEKVILVGHSMGGLLARYALTEPGSGRAARVSTVVTFGTPETGSDMADLIAGTLDAAAATAKPAAVLRLLLATCGALSTQKLETGSLCDFLPAFARAFDSAAGRALRTGSPQLAALKPFPGGIQLDALAGATTLKVGRVGWFASPLGDDDVAMGDMIVKTPSAEKGADSVKEAPCAYELNAYRATTDRMGLAFKQVANQDVAQPIWKVMGPCFHTNLMRTLQLTNEATGAISDDIGGRTAAGSAQPPLGPSAVRDSALPVCRDYALMKGGERDVAVLRMQEARHDKTSRTLTKLSVNLFCQLNPGRHIDGVYSPASRANPTDGGSGPIPTCTDWREMDDAAADAALLRVAREHGDADPHLSTLRLSVGALCKLFPKRKIDAIYLG